MTILDSQFCDPEFPEIFCSKFDDLSHETCNAMHASPIICGNLISGFLINDGNCSTENNETTLEYHSVGDFDEWIRQVTSGVLEKRGRFIVDVMQFEKGMINRAKFSCSGTLITLRHVLTTATCLNLPSSMATAIQFGTGTGSRLTSNTKCFVDTLIIICMISVEVLNVFIHPDYIASRNDVANIAIAQVNKFKLFC